MIKIKKNLFLSFLGRCHNYLLILLVRTVLYYLHKVQVRIFLPCCGKSKMVALKIKTDQFVHNLCNMMPSDSEEQEKLILLL